MTFLESFLLCCFCLFFLFSWTGERDLPAKLLQSCDPWTVAHQAPLSMGFSRQEYWSGSPCPFPEDLLNPGIKPESPASPGERGRAFRPAQVHAHLLTFFLSPHHPWLPLLCILGGLGLLSAPCPQPQAQIPGVVGTLLKHAHTPVAAPPARQAQVVCSRPPSAWLALSSGELLPAPSLCLADTSPFSVSVES